MGSKAGSKFGIGTVNFGSLPSKTSVNFEDRLPNPADLAIGANDVVPSPAEAILGEADHKDGDHRAVTDYR